MTTPNELALYGLSADGGVNFDRDTSRPPRFMTQEEAERLNRGLADLSARIPGFTHRWHRLCSLPAALNAERNERAVGACRETLEAIRDHYDMDGYEDQDPNGNAWKTLALEMAERARNTLTILSEGVNLSGSPE